MNKEPFSFGLLVFAPTPFTVDAANGITKNAELESVRRIDVFFEGLDSVPESVSSVKKLTPILRPYRPTFAELFKYANDRFEGNVVAVADAALLFDESISLLGERDLDRTLVCLGRRNNMSPHAGQDAWLFKAPLAEFMADWAPGIPGSDRRIAREASNVGLGVINPSYSIRIMRAGPPPLIAAPRVPAPHLEVPPCRVEAIRRKEPVA